ncbi:hypothetical protein PTQ24_000118 [Salmonella phage KKP_3822]|uniref:Uncharacterized protein n=1 Tax=Salmonella phage KKP_3822 TaxID=3027681 RepID=A0AAX4NEB3_9CAUD
MGLSTGQEITEADVFKASQGEVTPSFAEFWLGITLKEDAPEDGVVMQSMHLEALITFSLVTLRKYKKSLKMYLLDA